MLDCVGVATVLILLSPLMAVAAGVVALGIGAPTVFRQRRMGALDRPFTLYKFRTMSDHCDAEGRLLSDEARLTRAGRLLRMTSIDELPGLINVLRGEMSLVGPRPLFEHYLPLYSHVQRRRHEARPGITGMVQVSGRNTLSWDEKFQLDIWYVDHMSFWLDLRILTRTVVAALRMHGITKPGHATTDEFRGSSI
jgi:sugar transferase EpsL